MMARVGWVSSQKWLQSHSPAFTSLYVTRWRVQGIYIQRESLITCEYGRSHDLLGGRRRLRIDRYDSTRWSLTVRWSELYHVISQTSAGPGRFDTVVTYFAAGQAKLLI